MLNLTTKILHTKIILVRYKNVKLPLGFDFYNKDKLAAHYAKKEL